MNKQLIICGNLCNYDLALGELFARYEMPVKIWRHIPIENQLSDSLPLHFLGKCHFISGDPKASLFTKFNEDVLVLSLTNTFYFTLGKIKTFYALSFKRVKLVNCSTGSDVTELLRSRTLTGYVYRWLWDFAQFNIIPPYPEAIKSIRTVNSKKFFILRYPYLLFPRTAKLDREGSSLVFLHASNIDFGVRDDKFGRNSTKGNDKFFKAFIRLLKQGFEAKCIVLDRGPDREIVKELISKEKVEQQFTWTDPTDSAGLQKLLSASDIVVDQFDVGGFGMIAIEAMAQGKPVMIHIDKNCWPLVYDDEPPVINCHTEDEIFHAIMKWSDREKLQDLGDRAEKWVRKHHDVHTADFSEFIMRICLAAGLEWPRPDLAKQTT